MEQPATPVDQLKEFALKGQPSKTPTKTLNLIAYWAAINNGAPIPRFSAKGAPVIKSSRVTHILNSPWSDAYYAEANGIEEPIVRHIRRMAAEGRLPPRDDLTEVIIKGDQVKIVKKLG